MASCHGEPELLTPADEAYVAALFFTPEERAAACRSADGISAVYVVHLDPWLRPLPLGSWG